MERPEKRHWFQIHLSTAVFLMLEMSVVVGLNASPAYWDDKAGLNSRYYYLGFPVPMIEHRPATYHDSDGFHLVLVEGWLPGLPFNLIINGIALWAGTAAFEAMVRSREARRAED